MKLGTTVRATSGRGPVVEGRFAGEDFDVRGGKWIKVNVAPKGKPAVIKRYRPKAVVKAE